eukprot:727626-Prymnesium_polylepis.1
MAEPTQLALHADVVCDGDGFKDQLEDKHGYSKEDEEQEETLCRITEPVAAAGVLAQLARLDRQHAHVQKDEGQRLEAKVEPEEGDADEERHDTVGNTR